MTPLFAAIDPWILTFSALTVFVTIWMGFWSAKQSKTTSDFFVAGRSVGVGWNASAISGEYLSAASFMGVAGMVMSSGYDALWYPVCYACGYLFLLLFIAGPLRRFGAYTIPDFAEGRFDSPLFRKIAVVFVLFIGFFYTMPQMKGAGTTLAYIFPGLPYWAGVVLVGAVITLNVALGGMKGITLVQAFQYWLKMFAISVPIFVLMAVYGSYGKQLRENGSARLTPSADFISLHKPRLSRVEQRIYDLLGPHYAAQLGITNPAPDFVRFTSPDLRLPLRRLLPLYGLFGRKNVLVAANDETLDRPVWFPTNYVGRNSSTAIKEAASSIGVVVISENETEIRFAATNLFVPGERSDGRAGLPEKAPRDQTWLNPFGPLTSKAAKAAGLSGQQAKPYALLYTYSLIIALVCGTAGLPHILVRFYTNPDGVAAKRTTMWVMILIGVFYLFPPIFGVMGRNLLPELYAGTGAKGTDKVVLELPRILNEPVGESEGGQVTENSPNQSSRFEPLNRQASPLPSLSPARSGGEGGRRPGEGDVRGESIPVRSPTFSPAAADPPKRARFPWGSILSGITCAGAFAAFMSTFSGLLVSMTGAMAHDVYGRMLNPKATPRQRLRAFRIAAVGIGGVAIVLGMQVEPLQINFMVGQAFAIAAASYFPLLFMAVWWRKLTMKGAATGTLTGGLCAVLAISLTSFSDLAAAGGRTATIFSAFRPLNEFWAAHPLLRILCEQPALWTVPLAIGLMILVSRLTAREVPSDIRMKMLVLHAPEKLGLKQEYIREHEVAH